MFKKSSGRERFVLCIRELQFPFLPTDFKYPSAFTGFSGGTVVKNPPANAGECKRLGFHPWVRKIPWSRKWQPTPVFLPGESMDRGAWWVIVHRVQRVRHD